MIIQYFILLSLAVASGILFFLRKNVAAHKEIEAAARTNAILKTVVDGIITINSRGVIESFNPSAERIFGYEAQEVLGQNVKVLMPEPYHSGHDGYLKHHIETGERRIIGIGREVLGRRKNGDLFAMELAVSGFTVHGQHMFAGSVREITERKHAEELRLELINRLMQSNTELERFAYVASHDMQEPVRMITNFSAIIMADYKNKLDETGQEYLRLVRDSGERMRTMIEDLLAYSRLENEGKEMIFFDGEQILEGVLQNLQELIKEKKAEITHDPLPELYGNPVQILRLMQNLITNAIKYQPKGNIPRIHIGVEDGVHHWCLSVKDNGLGIKQDFIEQIFQPFRRLHTWDTIQGTGLGLSICRKIAQSHGGDIKVTSQLGNGSVFSIFLLKPEAKALEAA